MMLTLTSICPEDELGDNLDGVATHLKDHLESCRSQGLNGTKSWHQMIESGTILPTYYVK